MTKKHKQIKVREGGFLTREMLENPHANIPWKERMIKSGAIDLRDNHKIEDLGNGYCKITPIDPTKKWTLESLRLRLAQEKSE